MFETYVMMGLFFAIPVAVLIWFVVSLVLYLRRDPQDAELSRRRKILLIVSAVILGIIVLAIVAFWILLMIAIANM